MRRVRDRPEPPAQPEDAAPEAAYLEQIRQRYRYENRFLDAVRNGLTGDALRAYDRMTTVSSEIFHRVSIYRDPQVSFSIMRTLIRKAAEEGGLSVITIDVITQRAAQKASTAASLAEQQKQTRDLVRDLTEAVHQSYLRTEGCSQETKLILEYLHLHYAEPVRIEDLTGLTGYSRSHISTAFKRDKGMSILSWVAMLRCHKARELLRNTEAPVSDIAAAVGYDDANYFVKVYKKQTGETPSETRAKRE